VPLGTFTGSTPDPGESLALRETDAGGAGVDVVGVLTGSPLHAAASKNTKAHVARRMSGSVSGPT